MSLPEAPGPAVEGGAPAPAPARGDVPVETFGEDGPAIVLLSGWPLPPAQWQPLIPHLAGRFRVVVPDLTGVVPGEGAVAAIGDVLAAAGGSDDRVSLVGQGTGAAAALDLIAAGAEVEAAVLLGPALPPAWPSAALRDVLSTVVPATTEEVDALLEALLIRGSADESVIDRALFDEARRRWAEPGGVEAFAQAREAILAAPTGADGGPAPVGAERETALAAVDVPILILWGDEDPFALPDVAEDLHDLLGSATLGLVPGCGNFPLEETFPTIGPMIAEYLHARALGGAAGHAHDHEGHAHAHGGGGGQLKDGVALLQLEKRPPWVDELVPNEGEEDRW